MLTLKMSEQQKEWVLKVATGIVALVFCHATIIAPVFQDLAFLHRSIRDSQKRIELYHKVSDLRANIDNREKSLVVLTDRSQLLGKISDVAARNQIRVQTLTPKTDPNGAYVRLKIEVDGEGSFFSLIKFLQAVEKIVSAIRIKAVSVLWKPSSESRNKHLLQIQLIFETFLKQQVRKNA